MNTITKLPKPGSTSPLDAGKHMSAEDHQAQLDANKEQIDQQLRQDIANGTPGATPLSPKPAVR